MNSLNNMRGAELKALPKHRDKLVEEYEKG